MDVVLNSGETSDDENHSEKTDENADTPVTKEKKPRLTKMQKLDLDIQKLIDEITKLLSESSKIHDERSKLDFTNETESKKFTKLDMQLKKIEAEISKKKTDLDEILDEKNGFHHSDKKVKKDKKADKAEQEPRTKTSKIVQPTPQFLDFMKHLSLEETPVFTKETIVSMIKNYIHEKNLYVTFGTDADDKETRSAIRKKDLESRNIQPFAFNKPFNLDENLKTLYKKVLDKNLETLDEDAEIFPTEYVLMNSHIKSSKYLSNLFTEIVTEK
jgi:hypothetical protein